MRIIGVNGARHKISGTLQKDDKYTGRKGELKLFDQINQQKSGHLKLVKQAQYLQDESARSVSLLVVCYLARRH